MHIDELEVENFKGITQLKFNPKNINIIVGRNNTGKTSLLESIDFLFNTDYAIKRLSKYTTNVINVNSDASKISVMSKNKSINIEIRNMTDSEVAYYSMYDITNVIMTNLADVIRTSIQFDQKTVEKIIIGLQPPSVISALSRESIILIKNGKYYRHYINYDVLRRIKSDYFSEIVNTLIKTYQLKNNNLKRFFYPSFIRDPNYIYFYLHDIPGKSIVRSDVLYLTNPLNHIHSISEDSRNEKIVEKLHHVEEIIKKHDLIKNLERLELDYVIFREKNKTKTIPFKFLGDGFKSLVGILFNLSELSMKNSIILLDEPDTHMHPGYIRELAKIIIEMSKELNLQFFIATHNDDFINSFLDESLTKQNRNYLKSEFLLLGLDILKTDTFLTAYNYDEAISARDDLLLDLRGI